MDADLALIDLARRQHGLVLRPDVTRAQVTPRQWNRRVHRGEWVKVCPDVWRHALTPDDWNLRARAGLLYLGRDAALFAHTAAAWWGLAVPPPAAVEFVVPRGRRFLSNDLIVHTTAHWDTRDLLRHDGVRVTSVTRTIIDMAAAGGSAKLVEDAIDSAVHQKRTTIPRLLTRMNELERARLPGIRLLRALLLDSGGESTLERKFLKLVRTNSLPRPTCQVEHRSEHDNRVVRVDFEYPQHGVIVEVSGRLGHVSDRERQKDGRRRNALQRTGLTFLEFTTADVLDDAPYVIATLRENLDPHRRHAHSTARVAEP